MAAAAEPVVLLSGYENYFKFPSERSLVSKCRSTMAFDIVWKEKVRSSMSSSAREIAGREIKDEIVRLLSQVTKEITDVNVLMDSSESAKHPLPVDDWDRIVKYPIRRHKEFASAEISDVLFFPGVEVFGGEAFGHNPGSENTSYSHISNRVMAEVFSCYMNLNIEALDEFYDFDKDGKVFLAGRIHGYVGISEEGEIIRSKRLKLSLVVAIKFEKNVQVFSKLGGEDVKTSIKYLDAEWNLSDKNTFESVFAQSLSSEESMYFYVTYEALKNIDYTALLKYMSELPKVEFVRGSHDMMVESCLVGKRY